MSMKVPQYVMEHFRYTDTMNCIKEDIRSGKFSEDAIWYSNIVDGIEEIRDWTFLGFTEGQYKALIKQFEQRSLEDKKEISKEKYDSYMTDEDKAIEQLKDYYNAIYDRFIKKLNYLKA